MKKVVFVVLILIVLVGVAACSKVESPPKVTLASTTTTLDLQHSYGKDYNSQFPPAATFTQPAPTVTWAVPAPTTAAPPVVVTESGGAYNGVMAASTSDRMVIRTASMDLVVDDVSRVLTDITNLATGNGGFVVNSNIQEDQNRLYGNISFRVDATKFDTTLQSLRNMAVDVKAESTSGQDVTEQYTDLNSTLRNLEASETQLLELMKQAGTVADILQVQQQLTSTRGQIEQIKGQMQYLEQSSALAMINASLEQSKLTVEFTAGSRIVKVGEAVQFVPTIAGGISPYSYEWSFGDGGKSTEPNPAHTYGKTGTFTVSVKITDDKGNTDESTRTDYITVNVVPGWSAGNIASRAWHGLAGFFKVLLDIIIWIGILSPIWIIILVILYFAWWRRRKNKQKAQPK
ncbi:MAG: DUF4349 domain-containing protein [Dehalococcoidales bacterium]|jgi:hypothetical protein